MLIFKYSNYSSECNPEQPFPSIFQSPQIVQSIILSILLLCFLAHLTSWQTSRNGREKEKRFLYQPCFVKRVNVITIAETTIGLLGHNAIIAGRSFLDTVIYTGKNLRPWILARDKNDPESCCF